MRRMLWLALGVALFVVGGFLMRGRGPKEETPQFEVSYPRFGYKSAQRAKTRRTLLHKVQVEDAPAQEIKRDPLLTALAPGPHNLVIEANAIINSPVGELLLGCLDAEGLSGLQEVREQLGFDPVKDLDRIAFGPNNQLLISGHFKDVDQAALNKDKSSVPYGDHGAIYSKEGEAWGLWKDQMMIVGKSEEEVRASIDRLEARVPAEEAMPSNAQYGEAYGYVDPSFLTKLLASERLEARIGEVVNNIEFHVDTREAVAMVFQIKGDDANGLDELARAMGSAMVLARIQAKAKEDKDLEHLLESAKVTDRGPGGFKLSLAVSLDFIKERLGQCALDRSE